MDAIKKRIFWLLDNECAGCERIKGKIDHTPICRDSCSIYKELTELGTHLDDQSAQKTEKLTKQEYQEYKEENWKDTDICHRLKITRSMLRTLKKKWDIRYDTNHQQVINVL